MANNVINNHTPGPWNGLSGDGGIEWWNRRLLELLRSKPEYLVYPQQLTKLSLDADDDYDNVWHNQ